MSPNKGPVDDGHGRRARAIVGGETATRDDLDAYRIEESFVNPMRARDLWMVRIDRIPLNTDVQHAVAIAAKRECRRRCHRLDAGDWTEMLFEIVCPGQLSFGDHFVRDTSGTRRWKQPRRWEGDLEHELPLRNKPRLGGPEICEAAHQPSGTGDERNGQRNLGDDHRLQGAVSGPTAGRGAAALVHQRPQARASQAKGRRKPDE